MPHHYTDRNLEQLSDDIRQDASRIISELPGKTADAIAATASTIASSLAASTNSKFVEAITAAAAAASSTAVKSSSGETKKAADETAKSFNSLAAVQNAYAQSIVYATHSMSQIRESVQRMLLHSSDYEDLPHRLGFNIIIDTLTTTKSGLASIVDVVEAAVTGSGNVLNVSHQIMDAAAAGINAFAYSGKSVTEFTTSLLAERQRLAADVTGIGTYLNNNEQLQYVQGIYDMFVKMGMRDQIDSIEYQNFSAQQLRLLETVSANTGQTVEQLMKSTAGVTTSVEQRVAVGGMTRDEGESILSLSKAWAGNQQMQEALKGAADFWNKGGPAVYFQKSGDTAALAAGLPDLLTKTIEANAARIRAGQSAMSPEEVRNFVAPGLREALSALANSPLEKAPAWAVTFQSTLAQQFNNRPTDTLEGYWRSLMGWLDNNMVPVIISHTAAMVAHTLALLENSKGLGLLKNALGLGRGAAAEAGVISASRMLLSAVGRLGIIAELAYSAYDTSKNFSAYKADVHGPGSNNLSDSAGAIAKGAFPMLGSVIGGILGSAIPGIGTAFGAMAGGLTASALDGLSGGKISTGYGKLVGWTVDMLDDLGQDVWIELGLVLDKFWPALKTAYHSVVNAVSSAIDSFVSGSSVTGAIAGGGRAGFTINNARWLSSATPANRTQQIGSSQADARHIDAIVSAAKDQRSRDGTMIGILEKIAGNTSTLTQTRPKPDSGVFSSLGWE